MSELRDARMAKALEAAPDAQLRPSAQVRERIRSHAHEAVDPAAEQGFWSKLWRGSGQRNMPWNAAFATIALATLITVLWRDREPPAPEPASAPPRIEQPKVQQPAVEKQPVEKPAVESKRKASSPAMPAPPTAPVAADSVAQQPPTAPAREAQLERRESISADRSLQDKDVRTLEKSAPAAAEAERRAPQPQAAPVVPPQPRLAAPAPAAPAAGLSSRSQFAAPQLATALRISAPQGGVEVPLQRPSQLADLLDRSIRDARSTDALDAAVDLRVDLLRPGEMLGTLELAGFQLRWTPFGAAAGFTYRPDPQLLKALRDELGRLPVR